MRNVSGQAMASAINPPSRQIVAASVRNCISMVRRLAPMALRMPISFVRSATDTNMMFMIPMPPTKSERPVMNNPTAAMVPATRLNDLQELVLLVDGEVIGLVRGPVARILRITPSVPPSRGHPSLSRPAP